jgi:hypothetical protein
VPISSDQPVLDITARGLEEPNCGFEVNIVIRVNLFGESSEIGCQHHNNVG